MKNWNELQQQIKKYKLLYQIVTNFEGRKNSWIGYVFMGITWMNPILQRKSAMHVWLSIEVFSSVKREKYIGSCICTIVCFSATVSDGNEKKEKTNKKKTHTTCTRTWFASFAFLTAYSQSRTNLLHAHHTFTVIK